MKITGVEAIYVRLPEVAEQCDSGQGFLFSRPLEVGAIEAFLDRYETAPVTARS